MIPPDFLRLGCFYFLVFLVYNFYLSSVCGRLSRLMSAFERTLKLHLVLYRIVCGDSPGMPGSQADPTTARGQMCFSQEMEYRSEPLQSPPPHTARATAAAGDPTATVEGRLPLKLARSSRPRVHRVRQLR